MIKAPMIFFEEDKGGETQLGTGLKNLKINVSQLAPPPVDPPADNKGGDDAAKKAAEAEAGRKAAEKAEADRKAALERPTFKSPKAHENFERLEQAKSKAEKERDELRKQFDAEKKEWEKKLAEASTPRLTDDAKAEIARLKAEKEQYERDFKEISVTRAAQQQFGKQRQETVAQMEVILSQAGAEPVIMEALKTWDFNRLAEYAEDQTVPAGTRRIFTRLLDTVNGIDEQVKGFTADPERGFKALQERQAAERRNQIERMTAETRQLADGVFKALTAQVPAIEKSPELATACKASLTALAGGEGSEHFTQQRIMEEVVQAQILRVVAYNQGKELEALKKENADLKESRSQSRSLRPGARGADHVSPDNENENNELGTGLYTGRVKVNLPGR